MILGPQVALVAAGVLLIATAPTAAADPEPTPEPAVDVAPAALTADPAAVEPPPGPPVDDGMIVSTPPATSKSPDGWVLTVGAKDEIIRPVAPLTTALSSRDYEVGGVFNGSVVAPEDEGYGEESQGVLEVGYQVGCGIDMTTSNGVTLTGSVGVTPSVGVLGIDAAGIGIDGIAPVLSAPVSGGIAIGLKPGIVNIVPVSKKEYEGSEPWVSISGFHIKIDGCVGESFIRSYAVLTRSTKVSDAIQAYYGATKKV